MREKGERKRGKKERQGRISEQETKERGDGGETEKNWKVLSSEGTLISFLSNSYICQVSAGSMDASLCLILQGMYADAV